MIAKDGSLRCAEVLEFARGESCYYCGRRPPGDPHHYPTKGASGVTRDDCVVPACRTCHDAAHGLRVIEDGAAVPTPSARQQEKLVQRFRLRFMQYATSDQFEAYARARRAWLDQRQIAH